MSDDAQAREVVWALSPTGGVARFDYPTGVPHKLPPGYSEVPEAQGLAAMAEAMGGDE